MSGTGSPAKIPSTSTGHKVKQCLIIQYTGLIGKDQSQPSPSTGCHSIPFPRNEDLVRRNAITSKLDELLPEISGYRAAALWGLGGSGSVGIYSCVYKVWLLTSSIEKHRLPSNTLTADSTILIAPFSGSTPTARLLLRKITVRSQGTLGSRTISVVKSYSKPCVTDVRKMPTGFLCLTMQMISRGLESDNNETPTPLNLGQTSMLLFQNLWPGAGLGASPAHNKRSISI